MSHIRETSKLRLKRYAAVAAQLKAGLEGTPFSWRGCDMRPYMLAASVMGLTIISLTQAEKRGYTLRRGQKPVGRGYWDAPISRYSDLYVLEIQFKKVGANDDKTKPGTVAE